MEPVPLTISNLLTEAAKIGFVVLLLLVAVIALVAWIKGIERDRKEERASEEQDRKERDEKRDRETKEREAIERQRCQDDNNRLANRINFLEERSHQEAQGMLGKCLETMQTCASAINGMVELEKTKQTGSGSHPTVGGANAKS